MRWYFYIPSFSSNSSWSRRYARSKSNGKSVPKLQNIHGFHPRGYETESIEYIQSTGGVKSMVSWRNLSVCSTDLVVIFKVWFLPDYWAISVEISHRSQSELALLCVYHGYVFAWTGSGRPVVRSEFEAKIVKQFNLTNQLPLLGRWSWGTLQLLSISGDS